MVIIEDEIGIKKKIIEYIENLNSKERDQIFDFINSRLNEVSKNIYNEILALILGKLQTNQFRNASELLCRFWDKRVVGCIRLLLNGSFDISQEQEIISLLINLGAVSEKNIIDHKYNHKRCMCPLIKKIGYKI